MREDPALIADLLVGGCHDLLSPTTCLLSQATSLTLWLDAPPNVELQILVDGRPRPVEWARIDGGFRGTLTVTATAASLRLTGRLNDRRATRALEFRRWARPAALERAARQLGSDLDRAAAELESLEDTPDRRAQVEARLLEAKIAFRRGAFSEANALRKSAADLADKAGWPDTAARARGPIAFVALRLQPDFPLARATLDEMSRAASSPYRDLLLAYHEGRFQRAVGDPRRAIRRFEEAARLALRINDQWTLFASTQSRVNLLSETGLHREALDSLRGLGSPAPAGCPSAWWYSTEAWLQVMAIESRADLETGDPVVASDKALAIFDASCPQPPAVTNALVIKGLALAQRGEWTRAGATLERALERRASMPSNAPPWIWEVQARVALAANDLASASSAYAAMEAFAGRAGQRRWQWWARAGSARVHARAGRSQAALRAYEAAETLAQREAPSTLRPSGSTLWGSARDRVAEAHASLHLRAGRPEASVEVLVRRSRRRLASFATAARIQKLSPAQRSNWEAAAQHYASLRAKLDDEMETAWSRANWRKSAPVQKLARQLETALDATISALGPPAELRALTVPPKGELLLGFEDLEGCVLAFAWSRWRRVVRRMDCPEAPLTQPGAWLEPFLEDIDRTDRIVIHAQSRVRSIDLHAVEIDGVPLGAAKTVVYAVGAPRLPQREAPAPALVVSDPSADLPLARDEGQWVSRRLRQAGWSIIERSGRAVARDMLEQPLQWLHWAGHGLSRSRSFDSLGTGALRLADGASIEPADVLTLTAAPRNVVMTACQTAPTGTRHLTLGEAFVLAGSRAVVSTTRSVTDEDAAAFAKALYQDPRLSDPTAAIRAAYAQLAPSKADWAAFRVFIP